jgi:hypothetical protein
MTTLAPRPAALLDSARLPGRSLGRTAALLALGSATVHLLLVDVGTLGSLALLCMALACLPCAWHLWRTPTGSTWATTAGLDAAMLTLHAQLLAPAPGSDHLAHHPVVLMWSALGLVTAQLLLAGVAGLAALRR